MKAITPRQRIMAVALIATGLLPGCSGPSNNTQRGAAGGAALGALAGAVIGNNRGSGNAASGAAIGAAAGAIAGGALGHSRDVQDRRATSTYEADSQAATNIVVRGSQPPMPPAPMAENMQPRPSPDAVWIAGYWSYENGTNYAWVPGRWEIPPSGYRYFQPPHWAQRGDDYVYVRGYWQP